MASAIAFRFDPSEHIYSDSVTGEVFPSITQCLARCGLVDDAWFTAESAARGTEIHRLTAEFDLGSLDPDTLVSPYRNWLLAHVKAMKIMQPDILSVEQPMVHPTLKFGGRPDRAIIAYGLRGVLEIKTGVPSKADQIQLALQALLLEDEAQIPAHAMARWVLYLKQTGKFQLVECKDRRDFDVAHDVVRRCCR